MQSPSALSRIVSDEIVLTPPVISLIVSNILVIALAISGGWDFTTIILVYWLQNLIIGFFTIVKLLSADTGLILSEVAAARAGTGTGTPETWLRVWLMKIGVSVFFVIHYGLFNLFYFILFIYSGSFGAVDLTPRVIWIPLIIFTLNHLFSMLWYWKGEKKGGIFMANSILLPYIRILPMHLTLLIGGFVTAFLQVLGFTSLLPMVVIFLALKAFMDIRMHIVTHGIQARDESLIKFFGF